MLIKYFFAALCVLCYDHAWSQYNLSGHIYDLSNHQALSGVTVYINDLKTGTISDSNGIYRISSLQKGTYLLEFSQTGYKTKIVRLSCDKNIIVDIELQPAVAELNNVVVTAVSRGTELMRTPIILKTVDKNELNQQGSTNLIDALKNVPGISQVSTGSAISKPVIRGLGYNRVITLYNGMRQEGQQWGDEHGIEIDEYSVDKIEIVKGPGSLLYGSDGIAGVINFMSAKAPSAGQIKTQLTSNYQSNNHLLAHSISNTGNYKGLLWSGRLTHKMAGNYRNSYDGVVYNSGFKEYDGNFFAGLNRKWGHTHLQLSTFNNILSLPEGERDSNGAFVLTNSDGQLQTAKDDDLRGYQTGFPHQRVNHIRLASNNYFILPKGSLNVDVGFQQNKRREYADVMKPDDVALYFDLRTFNYNIRYHFSEVNQWETSIGASGMQQSNRNKGLEYLIPAYSLFDAGIYLLTQKTFQDKLILSGGLRFDSRNMQAKALFLDTVGQPVTAPDQAADTKFSALRKTFYGISGSAGFSWLLTSTATVKVNISRGYRAPGISELSSNGRHEGTFRYEVGSAALRPEISHQIDVAFFKNTEHLTLEISPFVNFISHYIYTEKMVDSNGHDIIPDPADPAPAFEYVQGNARLSGGEIYLDFHPHPLDWLHIEQSFSAVKAVLLDQSDSSMYLPFTPAPKYKGELKAAFKKVGRLFSNVYIKAGIDYYFKQQFIYSAYNTETITPGYLLINAGVGGFVKTAKKKDLLGIFIYGDNLGNKAFQSHLSRLKYAPENIANSRTGVFNMGRNVSIKLVLNL